MNTINEHKGIVTLSAEDIDAVGSQVVGGYDHTNFGIYAGAATGFLSLIIAALAYFCPRQTQAQANPALNNVMGNNNRANVYVVFNGVATALSGSFRTFFGTLAADVNPNNGQSSTTSFQTAQMDIESGDPAP
jgi:hypothetical protein